MRIIDLRLFLEENIKAWLGRGFWEVDVSRESMIISYKDPTERQKRMKRPLDDPSYSPVAVVEFSPHYTGLIIREGEGVEGFVQRGKWYHLFVKERRDGLQRLGQELETRLDLPDGVVYIPIDE